MASNKTISLTDRMDRAVERADLLTATVVATDPFIVEVDSDHSGRTHMVSPEHLYCTCGDNRHRGGPCYHVFYLAEFGSEDVKRAVRSSLTDRMRAIQDAQLALKDDVTELYSLETEYRNVRRRLSMQDYGVPGQGSDESEQSTVSISETEASDDDGDLETADLSKSESRGGSTGNLRGLVDRLTSGD